MNNRKGSAGGKVMAVRQREQALKKYYEHPNVCLNCEKIIDVKKGQKVGEVRKRKFCNHQCSAAYTNIKRGFKLSSSVGECVTCKNKIMFKKRKHGGYYSRKYCPKCLPEFRAKKRGANTFIANLTKDQVMSRYAKYYIGRSMIRKHAKRVFEESNKDKKCVICGYNKHVDVAHVKSVSDFMGDVLMSTINHINNLVGLCPTHHWEYDEGLVKLEDIANLK